MRIKEIFKITWIPVVAASLCCLTPLVLVLLGLSTVSFASSLSDTLYYGHKWAFRSVGFVLLIISLVIYFRKKGVCNISQAKKRKNEIINTFLIAFIAFVIGYIILLGVIVEFPGVWLGIWDSYWAEVLS